MTLLHWRDGSYRDQKQLQRFVCAKELRTELAASGASSVVHRHWEWQVQDALQNWRIKGKSWTTRVGVDADGGLGAVQISQEINQGAHYDLVMGAVSLHLRHGNLFVGDEMIADTVDVILARCVEAAAIGDVLLTTSIYHANRASRAMVKRHKFEQVGVEGDYQLFERHVAIPDPELFT